MWSCILFIRLLIHAFVLSFVFSFVSFIKSLIKNYNPGQKTWGINTLNIASSGDEGNIFIKANNTYVFNV